ncbi:MAG TPA: hypothetical protein PKH98_06800, partial [Candidatus Omnitrophota bacterium]|nr:hypothetical protein [Candidatus Omnitrophota bacterium]
RTLVGNFNDNSSADTLFGKIADVKASLTGGDLSTIKTKVIAIEATLGVKTDTVSSGTIFGDLNQLESLTGLATDADTKDSVFGRLNDVKNSANKGKQSADAALSIIQEVKSEMGFDGQSTTVYKKMDDLESVINELENSVSEISDVTNNTETRTVEMLDVLADLVNQSAENLGLNLEVKKLMDEERADTEKIKDKLEEIDAKVSAIRESMAQGDIVVKTWFESE